MKKRDDHSPRHFPSRQQQKPPSTDPELTQLVAAWPPLPNALKAGIVAMVRLGEER